MRDFRQAFFGEKRFTNGLVSYSKFNGNFLDSVTGVTSGDWGSITFEASDFGQTAVTTDWGAVRIGLSSTLFDFFNSSSDLPFSIFLRVKQTTRRSYAFLISRWEYNIYGIFQLTVNPSGTISFRRFSLGDYNNYINTSVSGVLPLNIWTNLTITGDGSKNGVKIYVNGNLPTNTTTETGTYVRMAKAGSDNGSIMLMGDSVNADANRNFIGSYDFLAVWKNRCLTADEVKMLHNRTVELI